MDYPTDFETYWTTIQPNEQYNNRYAATKALWENDNLCPPQKRRAIIAWLRQNGPWHDRNPYFFIKDFQAKNREPFNWNGHPLQDGIQYVTAKYNGTWGTYTLDDARDFNMEVRQ